MGTAATEKTDQESPSGPRAKQSLSKITVRFAGDSGDGMQLTGDQFADTTAVMGNDFSTFPDFPAEIRAPTGTLPGVSSFQIQFSDQIIFTPGDLADVLVAMNPAALKVNLGRIKKGGLIIVNESTFTELSLKKAAWAENPLEKGTAPKDFGLLKVPLTTLTANALKELPLQTLEVERCKNFFALGMTFWMYDRKVKHTVDWINEKFKTRSEIAQANIAALKAGYNYADTTEAIPNQIYVKKAKVRPGTYRKITGNEALAVGLVTAAHLASKTLFYGSYPITPSTPILQELAKRKNFNVKTFQAEDEIAAIGAVVGAAFGGQLGVTATSGPGMCLKAETMNLAVMAELPMVVIDVQRAGPSTGMPTKTEQADLLQAMFGRSGESPVAVIAPQTPADCFETAIEAVRLAIRYMTPVICLSENYLANAAEPWRLPNLNTLPKITVTHPKGGNACFMPYARDKKTLARPWAIPGTPGLQHRIGGLGKAHMSGNVSYDPENSQKMTSLRAQKIQRIANDIPEQKVQGPKSGKLLVVSWGGTYGAISQAVSDLKEQGKAVSHAHLRYLNPFPKNLKKVLQQFDKIWVPELNTGQLLFLLRAQFPRIRATGYNKVKGQPFGVAELVEQIKGLK